MKKYLVLLLSLVTLQAYSMIDYSTLSEEEARAKYLEAVENSDINTIRALLSNPYLAHLRSAVEPVLDLPYKKRINQPVQK